MRYYIASGLENHAKVRELKAILDARGWEHTYDWTVHGSVQKDGAERIGEVAASEIEGVYMADVVITMLPGGRGTHVELGGAITLSDSYVRNPDEKPEPRIIIFSENPADFDDRAGTVCAFYLHPNVERVTSWERLLYALGVEQ